jgi:hypothetical protein
LWYATLESIHNILLPRIEWLQMLNFDTCAD